MYVPSESAFMIYLRVRWYISHIFRSCSLLVVSIENICLQLALPYSEPDYLTWNPDYPTWSRPTVEPVWCCVKQDLKRELEAS